MDCTGLYKGKAIFQSEDMDDAYIKKYKWEIIHSSIQQMHAIKLALNNRGVLSRFKSWLGINMYERGLTSLLGTLSEAYLRVIEHNTDDIYNYLNSSILSQLDSMTVEELLYAWHFLNAQQRADIEKFIQEVLDGKILIKDFSILEKIVELEAFLQQPSSKDDIPKMLRGGKQEAMRAKANALAVEIQELFIKHNDELCGTIQPTQSDGAILAGNSRQYADKIRCQYLEQTKSEGWRTANSVEAPSPLAVCIANVAGRASGIAAEFAHKLAALYVSENKTHQLGLQVTALGSAAWAIGTGAAQGIGLMLGACATIKNGVGAEAAQGFDTSVNFLHQSDDSKSDFLKYEPKDQYPVVSSNDGSREQKHGIACNPRYMKIIKDNLNFGFAR